MKGFHMSDALSGFIQNYALAVSVLAAIVIIVVTYIVQRWVFSLIKRLSNSDKTPLPGGSILANIARIIIWLLGLAILSKVCFNYDLTAFVTALGVDLAWFSRYFAQPYWRIAGLAW